MNQAPPAPRRPYDRTRRLADALETRAGIVEAALRLLRTVRPEDLSLADVAEEAGVAVRTVYRHFPSPADLREAAARAFVRRLSAPLPGGLAKSFPELPEQLGHVQRQLSKEPSLYPLFFALPARSEVGMGSSVRAWAGPALEKVPPEHHAAFCGVIELLASPYAWQVLHAHWGLAPERITRACVAAMQAVCDGLSKHPEWLDPAAPLPPRFQSRERRAPRKQTRSGTRKAKR